MSEHDRENEDTEATDETTSKDDDTEGQALTWKVRKPIPEASEEEDDAEGHAFRPPPANLGPPFGLEEGDDTEGHSGAGRGPRAPVD